MGKDEKPGSLTGADCGTGSGKTYAERQAKEGYAYGKDTVWQKEFEELFHMKETEDQLSAIEDNQA